LSFYTSQHHSTTSTIQLLSQQLSSLLVKTTYPDLLSSLLLPLGTLPITKGLDLSEGLEFHGQDVAYNRSVGVLVQPIRLAVGFYRVLEVVTTMLEEVVRVDVLTHVDVTRVYYFYLAFKI
jgi:hypothetical protein